MAKKELIKLIESVTYGYGHFTIKSTGFGTIRLYDSTDTFTATFISHVLEMTGDHFTGISKHSDGRPYMLFNF